MPTRSDPSTSATPRNSPCGSSPRSILDLTGSRSKIVHRPLPQDDPRQRRPDISEAERLLGWRPVTPLREGLSKDHPLFRGTSVAERSLSRRFAYDGASVTPWPALVTGGAGYVGAHACKALAKAGYLPVAYDNLSTGHESFVRWGPLDARRTSAITPRYATPSSPTTYRRCFTSRPAPMSVNRSSIRRNITTTTSPGRSRCCGRCSTPTPRRSCSRAPAPSTASLSKFPSARRFAEAAG